VYPASGSCSRPPGPDECTRRPTSSRDRRRTDARWVSSTVRDLLLGGEWSFAERGEHARKGINGAWRLYDLATGIRRPWSEGDLLASM
jgi:hypothetical protein